MYPGWSFEKNVPHISRFPYCFIFLGIAVHIYPLVNVYIAIENCHLVR